MIILFTAIIAYVIDGLGTRLLARLLFIVMSLCVGYINGVESGVFAAYRGGTGAGQEAKIRCLATFGGMRFITRARTMMLITWFYICRFGCIEIGIQLYIQVRVVLQFSPNLLNIHRVN